MNRKAGNVVVGIEVTIIRYVGDEPQPGIVEFQLEDAHGRLWAFVDKTPIVNSENLNAQTTYPRPGVVACEVVGRLVDSAGREVIQITTERPWCVESVEGATQFNVLPTSVVDLS